MRSGTAHTAPGSSPERIDSLEPEDDILSNLSKEITDALLSYERTAAPIFETSATIKAYRLGDEQGQENFPQIDCGISFDSEQEFSLELTPVKSLGMREEYHVEAQRETGHQHDKKSLRQQVSPWIPTTSFDSMRTSVGSILRRASSANTHISSQSAERLAFPSQPPSRESRTEHQEHGTISFQRLLHHGFDPVIAEEPDEPFPDINSVQKKTPSNLSRLAQKEAEKAARKAEKKLRKTSSAAELSERQCCEE